ERSLGRVRPYPRAPRTIDIDILCIGGVRIQDGRLTVPHPRMGDRPFVIHPLAEIAPELILPDGCTAQERRDRLGSTGIVRVTDV
ncbi:MAG TPA: 2-amino-4-hydroxy-6-hydroxymethyldihydropteridine diphosphokinase, partial [Deltaproteobacteria bacterium]|nr:2-amino-4-hydroxy-6-hydroxymethyldihydropteridine diphosphokinase [Deltaproteobacteria bacterium]